MSTISINGQDYSGRNIIIRNGNVIIDGRKVTSEDKVINIVITGDIQDLTVDSCDRVTVHGNVNSLETTSGDVSCHNVGDVKTISGDVDAQLIEGNVKTVSGDITSKR